MACQELPVLSPDGHSARLRITSADAPGPGLLWLPALGVPAHKYDPFANALGEGRVACAVHEWRGIGSSSLRARRGQDWGYRELLQQDLATTIASLDPARRWFFGGHSLGGQFAAMAAARQPARCAGLVLVATGVPQARTFAGRQRLGIGLFSTVIPALTRIVGHYPGEQLRFAGREAGQVMRDWAATVRSGRYLAYGDPRPLDEALAALDKPALAVRMTQDWLVPEASMSALLAKLGGGQHTHELFDDARLGARADHFRWMRQPQALAARVAQWMRISS